jgi:hypothetical protein
VFSSAAVRSGGTGGAGVGLGLGIGTGLEAQATLSDGVSSAVRIGGGT